MSACCFPFHGQHSPQRTDRIGTNSTDKMVHSKIYTNMNAETTAIDKTFTVRYKSSGKNYPQHRLALNLLQGNLSNTKVFKSGGGYGCFLDSWWWFSVTDMCVYLLLSSGTPACWMENPLFFSSSTYVHTSQGKSIYVDTIKVISAHQSICHATWPSPVIADNRSNSQVNYLSL